LKPVNNWSFWTE